MCCPPAPCTSRDDVIYCQNRPEQGPSAAWAYTRLSFVGPPGAFGHGFGTPGGTRTLGLCLTKGVLCPTELLARERLAVLDLGAKEAVGAEPPAVSAVCCLWAGLPSFHIDQEVYVGRHSLYPSITLRLRPRTALGQAVDERSEKQVVCSSFDGNMNDGSHRRDLGSFCCRAGFVGSLRQRLR